MMFLLSNFLGVGNISGIRHPYQYTSSPVSERSDLAKRPALIMTALANNENQCGVLALNQKNSHEPPEKASSAANWARVEWVEVLKAPGECL